MKFVFFGDSVTEGCFELFPKGDHFDTIRDPEAGYVSILRRRLQEAFPEAGIEVVNAGISGNAATDGLARIDRDVIALRPDTAVVCFGLNGTVTPEEYAATMREIFRRLKENNIHTIFMTPNMFSTYVPDDMPDYLLEAAKKCTDRQVSGEMDRRMAAGKSAAEEYGVEICDAYEAWKRLATYGIDVTMLLSNRINHPTREMHRLFADMLFPMLAARVAGDAAEQTGGNAK